MIQPPIRFSQQMVRAILAGQKTRVRQAKVRADDPERPTPDVPGGSVMRYLSLFSGMEAAHLAWAPLGWQCVGVAEIEPAACALLRNRVPDVPNLGSVTDITDKQIKALGAIDVVVGGSPCQDLSVAGRRAGLGGARSSLFHQQMRIFNAARNFCGARWLVWENVPGAFSSNQGRDFAVVVGAMAGSVLPVPAGGWGSEGVALGDNGLVEWSVLDAQWFGVAQRRRRVFAVLDTGDWAHRSPILLEPDRLRGDSAPSRGAREGTASPLTARASSGGGLGQRAECDGGSSLIPHTAGYGGGRLSGEIEVAACLTAKGMRIDFEVETFLVQPVSHTLCGAGFDGSEDGTGRGTTLLPVPLDTTQITNATDDSSPKPGDPCHPLCAVAHASAIAFDCKAGGDTGLAIGEVPGSLHAAHGGGHAAVAFQSSQPCVRVDDVHATLNADNGPRRHNGALVGTSVRRLTPVECERLQGAPDGWTLVLNSNGKPIADGPRYKILGNSFAVPVIRWIGNRIDEARQAALENAA